MNSTKKILIINMEYSQDEVNEPINVDILVQLIPRDIFPESSVTIVYRDFAESLQGQLQDYDIVLISSKISSFVQLKKIVDKCTTQIVFIGGILAICDPDKLARVFPNVIFMTGEGEVNMDCLLRLAYTTHSISLLKQLIVESRISNVCFEYNGNIYISDRIVCDLSTQKAPCHRKVKDVLINEGLVRMETSRGCPWNKCTFCIMPWKFCGAKWRTFSNAKIEDEINRLIQFGVKQVYFTDEDFVGNYQHINDLCDIIIRSKMESGTDIAFGGSTSILTLMSLGDKLESCLQKMFQAKIRRLFIGIESGSDSQLKRYKKGVTASTNETIIKILKKYKFEIDYGFIMFDADTNMRELEENLDFIERTGLRDNVSRFAKKLRITPHTQLSDEYHKRGITTSDIDLNEMMVEYNFQDEIIKQVCDSVEKIDYRVSKETYRLQAIIRASIDEDVKANAEKKLKILRDYGYTFLRDCVVAFKENSEISKKIQQLLNDCFEKIEGQDR